MNATVYMRTKLGATETINGDYEHFAIYTVQNGTHVEQNSIIN